MSESPRTMAGQSLGTALPAEMKRVRDVMIPLYESIGIGGRPGVFMMKAELDNATAALAEGDILRMMHAYEALKGWKE